MRVDIHNHTTLCNHAEGSVGEYIERAIELGIDLYGFSEHAPMDFDPKYRLEFGQMQEYEAQILAAKAQYKDDIEIVLGYEVDWLPGHMDERVLGADVDYLIGSVHFIDKWSFDNPEFLGGWKERDVDEVWQAYFEAVEAMALSGKFDIVGHLDLIKVFKYLPKGDIRLLARDALQAIKKSGMALEINAAGLRKPIGELYPSKMLLEEAYDMGIGITFGSDAHSVEQVGFAYEEAVSLAKAVGFGKAAVFRNRQRELVNF